MPDIVRLLPDSIANQIAAGEVVQRPASVVKELMENAIDAGSRRITLLVRDAGKSLIQVIDDGSGMSVRDARMSFERHATSKIRTADDLFAIRTMGFRGEALASIAAVAQVEMRTRLHGEELGTLIAVEGSEVLRQEFTACAPGTGIAVKNLFFNVPARRNFLKSNPVELRHILEEFQRVAIAQPDIEFSFFQNDIELHHLQPSVLSKRLAGLFGAAIREQLVPCEEETSELSLRGYIGKPESAKKSRGDQYFFVNNRYIRSPYLQHAVVQAYEGLIAPDQFPFFVIFIDIDPAHIDVNVHPTKTEIKFLDERTVYALLKTAVRSALGKHHVTPALDFRVRHQFSPAFSAAGSGGNRGRPGPGRANILSRAGQPAPLGTPLRRSLEKRALRNPDPPPGGAAGNHPRKPGPSAALGRDPGRKGAAGCISDRP
jgi:DNA mismatch repair protein MutL